MKREELRNKLTDILSAAMSGGINFTQAERSIWDLFNPGLPPAEGATDKFRDVLNEVQRYIETNGGATESEMKAIWNSLSCAITDSERRQPTAEGAEEILESIVESLGDPIYIHNHVFEIRPYTVEHKTEWWIFHKEVASGEPLAQWLNKFATLHAQKMTQENLREELIAYDKAEWLKTFGKELEGQSLEATIESIDEYLKSKEQ